MTKKGFNSGTPLDVWGLRELKVPRFQAGVSVRPSPCSLALLGWLMARAQGESRLIVHDTKPGIMRLLGVGRETLDDAINELGCLDAVHLTPRPFGLFSGIEMTLTWDVIKDLLICNDSFIPETTTVSLPVTREGSRKISLTTRMVWGWLWHRSGQGQFKLHSVKRTDAERAFGPRYDRYELPFIQLEALGLISVKDTGYGGPDSPLDVRMCTDPERLKKLFDVEAQIRREAPDGES